jgi:hypothetical protein
MRAVGEPTGSRRLTDEPDTDDDACTSPFPYADDFDEWVADETAASDGPERRGSNDREESRMSDRENEQTAERDPESDDRDTQERDGSPPGNERRELGPIEDADEWGKDVPERGHGEEIA